MNAKLHIMIAKWQFLKIVSRIVKSWVTDCIHTQIPLAA